MEEHSFAKFCLGWVSEWNPIWEYLPGSQALIQYEDVILPV